MSSGSRRAALRYGSTPSRVHLQHQAAYYTGSPGAKVIKTLREKLKILDLNYNKIRKHYKFERLW